MEKVQKLKDSDCLKTLVFRGASRMRSGITFDGNEHRKQAKQRRKRAFGRQS